MVGKFKCRTMGWVTIKIRNSFMGSSVEGLITFNEGHQGLLKLYMHLRWIWGFSMEEKKGAVLCCIASEKSSVSKFSLREFDISYIMLYYIVNECIMVA